MRPSRRRTPDHLYVPVEQTPLVYKEVPELTCQTWREQPACSPELFHLGLGAAARDLPSGECGVSW
jgi:hypothetical protein